MSFFDKWLKKEKPLTAGIYHYQGQGDMEGYRFHIRIEEGGNGVLIINASKILHLNQTAIEYIKYILEAKSYEEIEKIIKKRYKIDKETIKKDYDKLKNTIHTLTTTDDICPITYLDVQRIEPFQKNLKAPYRMDLALTYKCNNKCTHCYVNEPEKKEELTTEQWKEIIRKLWDLGIPHITFTGGEVTLRSDLISLIEYAEDLGIITGLITNGRKLKDKDYVQHLVDAGIDHFQITLETNDAIIHNKMVGAEGAWEDTIEGIRNAIATPIYTITNTTLTQLNKDTILDTIQLLAELGIETFACNGIIYSGAAKDNDIGIPQDELKVLVEQIRDKADELKMRFIWYTPTEYCVFNPLELDIGIKRCTAAEYNMCIEPDGSVIPCQSYYKSLGNMLNDNWESIWNNPLAISIREHKNLPEKCTDCELVNLCAGGCPLYREHQKYICNDSTSSS